MNANVNVPLVPVVLTVLVLCHGRDIHPMWVKSFTGTLSNEVLVLSTKSEEDLESF